MKYRCIRRTITTGGTRAIMATAMTKFHSGGCVPVGMVEAIPTTTTFILSELVTIRRPEVLIPPVNEHDHEKGGDARAGIREKNRPEKSQRAGAVDFSRIHQFIGNGEIELPEQESGRGRGDQGDRQPHVGVDPPELADDLIGGDDAHRNREHQGDKDHPEENLLPAEIEKDDGKGRENGDDDLADTDR